MLIQIESGDAKSPRKVHIETDEGESYDFTAPCLAEAHKAIKKARADGWETLKKAK